MSEQETNNNPQDNHAKSQKFEPQELGQQELSQIAKEKNYPPANADKENNMEPEPDRKPADLVKVFGIPVKISAVLGRKKIRVSELIKLRENEVIKLDKNIGEAIDILVNDRLIARGEVVVVNEQIGITMTEIAKKSDF